MTDILYCTDEELFEYTAMLQNIKPETKGCYISWIEKPNIGDLSIIFHMKEALTGEIRLVALATDYLLEVMKALDVS